MGHVDDFLEYQQDLAALLTDPRVSALKGPRLILGHSMGGLVAVRALQDGVSGALGPCRAAILSAPMLGITLKPVFRMVAGLVTQIGRWTGKLEAWPPFGQPDRPYVLEAFEGNVLTGDPEIYGWMREALRAEPRLGLGWPSIGWFSAANAEMAWAGRQKGPEIPLLVLLGGDEAVVDGDLVRRAATRWGADFCEIPEGRHEVMIDKAEVRAQAWAAIDAFLAKHLD